MSGIVIPTLSTVHTFGAACIALPLVRALNPLLQKFRVGKQSLYS